MVKSPMDPVDQAVSYWCLYLVPQTFVKASLFKSNPLLCNHSPFDTFVYVIQLSEVLGLLDFKAPKSKDLFYMMPTKQKNSPGMQHS